MTFQPTMVGGMPAVCNCCGRAATGVGIGDAKEPRFLCQECVLILEQIKRVRRFDPYELEARLGGMEAAGPLIDEFGSDLAEWDEEQVLMFCGAIWKGCADKLREVIRKGEAPF